MKEARNNAKAKAAHQVQEAHKRKAEEPLADRPKRHSERLRSRIRNELQKEDMW